MPACRASISCIGLIMAIVASMTVDAAAADTQVSVQGVVGFGPETFVQSDHYAPIHIDVQTSGEPFQGRVIVRPVKDRKLQSVRRLMFPLEAGARTRKRFSDVFLVLPDENSLVVEIWRGSEKMQETHVAVSPMQAHQRACLALTSNRGAMDHLATSDHPIPGYGVSMMYGTPDYLPAHLRGYESVETVFIDDVSLITVSEEQQRALRHYVESGGRLVVSGGPAFQALRESFLGGWLPVELQRSLPVDPPLTPGDEDAPTTPGARQSLISIGDLREDFEAATIWETEDNDILMASRPMGAGELIYIAFSLSDQFVRNAAELPALRRLLIKAPLSTRLEEFTMDDVTAMDNALQQRSLLPMPAASTLAFAFALYLGVFLPALFFFLRGWKHWGWAWASMPAAILLSAIFIVQMGRTEAGARRSFVLATLMESRPEGGRVPVRSFVSIYSGRQDRLTVISPNDDALFEPIWKPLFRGAQSEPFFASTVDNATLHELEIPPRSARAFQLHYTVDQGDERPAQPLIYTRQSAPSSNDGIGGWTVASDRLRGLVTNPTRSWMRDAALIAYGRVEPLGDIAPGESREIELRAPGSGPLTTWADQTPRSQTARDINAERELAMAMTPVLASTVDAPKKAFLIGRMDQDPSIITAFSSRGLPPVTTVRSTAAHWRLFEWPIRASGRIHMERRDYEAHLWLNRTRVPLAGFMLDDIGDLPTLREPFIIELQPDLPVGGRNGTIEDAWGAIRTGGSFSVEVFDWSKDEWIAAPQMRQDGWRIFLKTPDEGIQPHRLTLPWGKRFVNPDNGSVWLRAWGEIYQMPGFGPDIAMNYQVKP